jgi:hypothetical protein
MQHDEKVMKLTAHDRGEFQPIALSDVDDIPQVVDYFRH